MAAATTPQQTIIDNTTHIVLAYPRRNSIKTVYKQKEQHPITNVRLDFRDLSRGAKRWSIFEGPKPNIAENEPLTPPLHMLNTTQKLKTHIGEETYKNPSNPKNGPQPLKPNTQKTYRWGNLPKPLKPKKSKRISVRRVPRKTPETQKLKNKHRWENLPQPLKPKHSN